MYTMVVGGGNARWISWMGIMAAPEKCVMSLPPLGGEGRALEGWNHDRCITRYDQGLVDVSWAPG